VLSFFEKDEMNKNDFFDEDFDYQSEEETISFKRSLKHKKPDDGDWDDHSDGDKRNKRKTRWKDIEDRLSRKALRDNHDWDYSNYDF